MFRFASLRKIPIIAALLFTSMFALAAPVAYAQVDACGCNPAVESCGPCGQTTNPNDNISNPDGTVSGQAPQPAVNAPKKLELDDPLETGGDIRVVFARGIQLMTGISGSLALAAFVWGGFQMLTAAGDAGKIEKGKDTLKYAVWGLVIIFGAYVALRAVYGVFGV